MIQALNKRVLQPGEQIRVLVVDDSVVIRRLVTHALEEDPEIKVVGHAANGVIALNRIDQLNPDVVSLDIEMPEMDGIETLRRIRRQYPHLRVIMFSTLTERGAEMTFRALSEGADDYVAKASNEGSLDRSLVRLRQELIPRIRQFFVRTTPVRAVVEPSPRPLPAGLSSSVAASFRAPAAVAIGVSTGGPTALSGILPGFPASFPLPVFIVQHMPPVFTGFLAERLRGLCALDVQEAVNGMPVRGGRILIARGDFHMRVTASGRDVRVALDSSPPQNSCRPSVDVLFASAAEVYGPAVIGVILTGMGQDGLRGAEMLKARRAAVLAQDESSSVVWGMPGAVVNAGLADRVLPLDGIVPEILALSGCCTPVRKEA